MRSEIWVIMRSEIWVIMSSEIWVIMSSEIWVIISSEIWVIISSEIWVIISSEIWVIMSSEIWEPTLPFYDHIDTLSNGCKEHSSSSSTSKNSVAEKLCKIYGGKVRHNYIGYYYTLTTPKKSFLNSCILTCRVQIQCPFLLAESGNLDNPEKQNSRGFPDSAEGNGYWILLVKKLRKSICSFCEISAIPKIIVDNPENHAITVKRV